MKNSILPLIVCSLFIIDAVQSQAVMTVTVGVSPQQSPGDHFIFVNRSSPKDEFTFDLSQVKASYFIGAGLKYDIKPFFLSAEAQYNKREYVYNVSYTFPEFGRSEEAIHYSETMHVINLPVSIGVDLGIVDVVSGILPQVIVSQQSDLENINGYTQKLSPVRLGWHTGLAANVSAMRIGVDYQMDFNNYADHAYIQDQSLALHSRTGRIVGTLSYQF